MYSVHPLEVNCATLKLDCLCALSQCDKLQPGIECATFTGMSYMMDFEKPSNVSSEDAVMEYEGGFRLVCDPKSLLYLFGEYHLFKCCTKVLRFCLMRSLVVICCPFTAQE
jgi:hypothetical protein